MRILFLTHRLPYAPNRGDRLRAWHMLRQLSRQHEMLLVSLAHDAEEASHLDDLASVTSVRIAARVPHLRNRMRAALAIATGSGQPLTHLLLDSAAIRPALVDVVRATPPDVVFAYCSSMARFALEPPLDRFPLVIDMIDADSAKWADLAAISQPPLRWIYRREARELARFEATAIARASATLAVNARERDLLRALAPTASLVVVANGVDLSYFTPPNPPAPGHDVVFCGVMDYPPNETGAIWLATDIWPIVHEAYPDATLWLVGARPTTRVQQLQSASAGVRVTGAVDDVRPYLWRASVATAPLHTARGVQNKVLEALASGLPSVITPAVRDGLPAAVQPGCRVAHEPRDFADTIVTLLRLTPAARRDIAGGADLSTLSWTTCLQPLGSLLEAARTAVRSH